MSDPVGNKQEKKPATNLLRSTLMVGAITFLSRLLGMVRDMVIAQYFGAGSASDAFFVAFRIPNFFRRLFAEGAFSQAFIPVLSNYHIHRRDEVRQLVARTSGTLSGILLLLTVLGVVAAPLIIWLFAPGFHQDPEKLELAVRMLRLTFPYLLLISLTAFSGAILNHANRFAVPAFTPVFLNLSLIGASVFLANFVNPASLALAWGVLIAGVVQFLFQLPFLQRLDLLSRPQWGLRDPGVRQILRLMIPALFSVSVSQIGLLLDTILASFLANGSISWLYYSDRLLELPLGMFGVAIATVVLPSLSRRHAEGTLDAFTKTLDWGVRLVLLIALPAAVALFLLAVPLLATLFYHGQMTARDVFMSALSLKAYAGGVIFLMLIKVLSPGYFARRDMKTPVKIGIIAMLSNMVLNFVFIFPLAHAGLALATTLSAGVNAFLLWRGLVKCHVLRVRGWLAYLLKVVIASGAMGVALWLLLPARACWLSWSTAQRTYHLTFLVGVGFFVYGALILLLGIRPWHFRRAPS